MKVKNLSGRDFDAACMQLSAQVHADGYSPDIIVGILTGGGYVGRKVYEVLRGHDTAYTEVALQREGTKRKNKGPLHKLIRHLPQCICDMLRIAEAKWLEHSAKRHTSQRKGEINFDPHITTILERGQIRVLVVDDAVDTGATLKCVIDYIADRYPGNTVRTAVITTTMTNPLVRADYSLYNNHTLCRFPWSNDAKKPSKKQ